MNNCSQKRNSSTLFVFEYLRDVDCSSLYRHLCDTDRTEFDNKPRVPFLYSLRINHFTYKR